MEIMGAVIIKKKAFWVVCLMYSVLVVVLGAIATITATNLTRHNRAILLGSRIHHQLSKMLSHAVSVIPGFQTVQNSVWNVVNKSKLICIAKIAEKKCRQMLNSATIAGTS